MLARRVVRPHAVLWLLGLFAATAAQADSWPQFRGARGDGAASTVGVFSGRNEIGLNVTWKITIGSGYSGMAVADGVIATAFSDGTSDVVALFDTASGKELWRVPLGPTNTGHDGSHTGPIATPAIDRDRVVALSADGRLLAVDRKTGATQWSVDLKAEYGATQPHYGFGTSPIVVDGVLIVEVGAADAAVVGFDPATGRKQWAAGTIAAGGESAPPDGVSYQSPLPLPFLQRRAVLATTNSRLMWIDPQRGEILFEAPHGGGGMGRGSASMAPVPAGGNKLFLAYKDESSALVELQGTAPETVTLEHRWEDRSIRNSYNIAVFHEGHVYAYSSRFLTCVDAATGTSRWRSRAPGDGFTLLVDGHVVVATKDGGIHVVRATPTAYEEVAGRAVFDDLSWTPPVFADGALYARSLTELARIDIASTPTPIDAAPETAASGDSRFGRFLRAVAAAEDKAAAVDAFVATMESWPLVEDDLVHFIYRGPGSDLAVAGDLFGARQERPMHRVAGTDLFYHTQRVDPDLRCNYLFIRDYTEILDPRNPRKTATVMLTSDMEFNMSGGPGLEMSWFAMPKWQAPKYLEGTVQARGRLEPHALPSAALGNRDHTVHVYLPAGYDAGEQRYPVVYVQGGKAARELGDWPRALDGLVGSRVKPLIAVFIEDETRGPQFTEMFLKELIPYVDGQFRTLATREGRAVVGAGFAGFGAILHAVMFPDTFGQAASQSAVVMDFMRGPLNQAVAALGETKPGLYLQWGRYELRNPHESWDMGDANRKLADELKAAGVPVRSDIVPDGTDWACWRTHTDRVLEALFAM